MTLNVDEVKRNYDNFLMDHCYTPLTSPSQKHPLPHQEPSEPDLELDDLAQTLSILEGTDKPQPIVIRSPVKVQKVLQKEPKLLNEKVTLLNKVNRVYKSVKQVLKTNKAVNKKVHEDDVLGDTVDELNENDFDVKTPKSKRTYKKRNSRLLEVKDDVGKTPQKNISPGVKLKKVVKNIPKPVVTLPEPKIVEPVPVPASVPEPAKSPDNKKIKKDKKQHKPVIDDGIALFSTPDIIRRVGKPDKIDGSESPRVLKPARIEDRSHSDAGRIDATPKPKLPQRLSLDSKVPTPDKTKPELDKKPDKTEIALQNELLFQQNSENIFVQQVLNNITPQDVKNIIEPNATVDAINAVIHTPETAIPPVSDQINPENSMNLDAPLDIDHTILDNINTDELISEDILYQVAKLVENPDLQNAIDKTLVDGSLALDPTIQQTIQPAIEQNVQPIIQVNNDGKS